MKSFIYASALVWLAAAAHYLAPTAAVGIEEAAPATVGLSAERLDEITQYLESEVEAGRIPGAVVLIARHGRIGYCEAVGDADIESGAPMTKDALFRIASMTKAVASVAVMMLVEEGRVELADPLSKYLPQFKNPRVLLDVDGDSTATR